MSRNFVISPAVRDVFGKDMPAVMGEINGPKFRVVACPACRKDIALDSGALVSVSAAMAGRLGRVVLAHASCMPSAVLPGAPDDILQGLSDTAAFFVIRGTPPQAVLLFEATTSPVGLDFAQRYADLGFTRLTSDWADVILPPLSGWSAGIRGTDFVVTGPEGPPHYEVETAAIGSQQWLDRAKEQGCLVLTGQNIGVDPDDGDLTLDNVDRAIAAGHIVAANIPPAKN